MPLQFHCSSVGRGDGRGRGGGGDGGGPGLGWIPAMRRRRRMRERDRRRRVVLVFDQQNGGKGPLVKAFTPLKKAATEEVTKLRRRE